MDGCGEPNRLLQDLPTLSRHDCENWPKLKTFPPGFASRGTQVWDLDYLAKGDFLGEVRLSKLDLATNVPIDGVHEFSAALKPKATATSKFNRHVQGYLRFTCQVGERISTSFSLFAPSSGCGQQYLQHLS